ncbi:hypothetical protein JTE90_008566 [Oedothorax gibbosus]|uniref:Uncharacterized protein n=1 Tax=Oedothorax gibbosus TaxID=931172 RepID=A0AAV6TT73_9ARAC|nr:hypothetical protein JTE90_008566 [Oedothorax gibbosus]
MCRSIKLTLKNKAKDKSEPEAIQEAKACIEDIFQNSEADLDLVEDSEQEAMERNEQLLDDIFDGIERRMRLLRTDVMKKFRQNGFQTKIVQESCFNDVAQKTEAGINLEKESWDEATEKNLKEQLDNTCNAAYEKIYKMKEEF